MNKFNPYKTNPLFERIEQERKNEIICVSRETIEKALAKMLDHCNYISCWACPFWVNPLISVVFKKEIILIFLRRNFILNIQRRKKLQRKQEKQC